MFKLQSPSKCSPFDAIHLLSRFSHCSKQFLNFPWLVWLSGLSAHLGIKSIADSIPKLGHIPRSVPQ